MILGFLAVHIAMCICAADGWVIEAIHRSAEVINLNGSLSGTGYGMGWHNPGRGYQPICIPNRAQGSVDNQRNSSNKVSIKLVSDIVPA